jgi:hypothetical protein
VGETAAILLLLYVSLICKFKTEIYKHGLYEYTNWIPKLIPIPFPLHITDILNCRLPILYRHFTWPCGSVVFKREEVTVFNELELLDFWSSSVVSRSTNVSETESVSVLMWRGDTYSVRSLRKSSRQSPNNLCQYNYGYINIPEIMICQREITGKCAITIWIMYVQTWNYREKWKLKAANRAKSNIRENQYTDLSWRLSYCKNIFTYRYRHLLGGKWTPGL